MMLERVGLWVSTCSEQHGRAGMVLQCAQLRCDKVGRVYAGCMPFAAL